MSGSRCSNPTTDAKFLSNDPVTADLVLFSSLAKSNNTANANGVLKSSSIAALKLAAGANCQSTASSVVSTPRKAVYSRVSANFASSKC